MKQLFKDRRGQITLFIILGIVILLSVVVFLFIKGNIEREELVPGTSVVVEELPTEFMPVQPFVEGCIEKTAEKGLKVLGQRGGYIYEEYLNIGKESTDGDALRFSMSSDMVVPYWFFLASDNSCIGECEFSSKRPVLKGKKENTVESQLARYVKENIDYCIDDFKAIEELNFDVEAIEDFDANVIIADEDVVVNVKYPLVVSKGSSKIELQNFYTRLDVNMNKIFMMSDYITALQRDYRFLETHTLNLITAFSGKDSDRLPPISDSSFELTEGVSWRKSAVRNDLRDILSSYISMLRMTETLNWQEVDTGNSYKDGLYNYGMAIPNNSTVKDMNVNFDYLDFWDIYFDLNCDGDECGPESAFNDMLPIGLQRYDFSYDVSYPVLVEVEDPSAFNNRGYSFNFMLESNLRDSDIMKAEYVPLNYEEEEDTMLCDENKRTSGELRLMVSDPLSNEALDDVSVAYTCIESCMIGKTSKGVLETSLPVCVGGFLSFRKEGYANKYLDYDAALDKSDVILVSLEPKKSFNVEIRKKVLSRIDGEWLISGEEKLEDYETAIATISREGEGLEIVELTRSNDATASLSRGDYDIEISLISEKEIYIPAETRKAGLDEYEIDALNMSSFTTGQTSLSYQIKKSDMEKDTLMLYVLYADIYSIPEDERRMEDTEITNQFEDLTKKYYIHLVPRSE